MKIIHCSLWGDMEISDLALSIIDTPHFQRLHYIKQTGFGYKVFPGATTSRFEHSLGVYHLTRRLFKELHSRQEDIGITKEMEELIAVAGLVHDIGHGPFSHTFDRFMEMCSPGCEYNHHEYRSKIIFRDLVATNDIRLSNEQVEFITERICDPPTKNWYDMLINNPISSFDLDKLDYLARDHVHYGLTMNIDVNRILKNTRVIDNKLCFCDRIYDEVHLFFFLRERMHQTIYRHSKIIYFENALLFYMKKYYDRSILWNENGEFLVGAFLRQTDGHLLNILQNASDDWFFLVETRKWKPEETFTVKRQDNQWENAINNVYYYKRKNPDEKIFTIKEMNPIHHLLYGPVV